MPARNKAPFIGGRPSLFAVYYNGELYLSNFMTSKLALAVTERNAAIFPASGPEQAANELRYWLDIKGEPPPSEPSLVSFANDVAWGEPEDFYYG